MGIKSLACPMSSERIDKNVVRSSAVITAQPRRYLEIAMNTAKSCLAAVRSFVAMWYL